ncbi:cubilin-like [Haliotis cracherodii]|uniref:cubilin-like n=1 Tax=Haliotis cracherodii TaxID=6455 RepID=UPI0039E78F41
MGVTKVHGDTIRLTAKPNSQSYISNEYVAPTDRIIITAAMKEVLVRLRIKSTYNLSEEDCATSAVKVTSGKAGLYVGSYCGKQTQDWFYASHNTETIVFRSSKVAAGLGRINVTYGIHNWLICSGEMFAYHHPRYIRSPQYPLPFRDQKCLWSIAGLNNERVSITVKSANFSTIDCSTFKLTIFDVYDALESGPWCGGPDKIYFSHWSLLHILVVGEQLPSAGFEIEYTAIPGGSTELKRKWEICGNKAHNYITIGNSMSINFVTTTGRGAGFKLTYERLHTGALTGCAGDVRQVTVTLDKHTIQSVGYPTGYFDDPHCRWLFKARHGGDRIKINFTILHINTDVSTCTDAIRVYDGSNSTARRLEEGCSSRWFSLKSTGRSLYVEFVTDSVNVGSGFVMQCSSLYVQKTSQPYKTPLIAAGCLLGAVIIVVIACLSKRRCGNSTGTASTDEGLQVYSFPPSYLNLCPPSYSNPSSPICSENWLQLDDMNAFAPQPSYSEFMNEGATNVPGNEQTTSPAGFGGTGESIHM